MQEAAPGPWLMPKAPAKTRLFGWRAGKAIRKMPRSYRKGGSRDESGISGQVYQDAEGDSGRQDVCGGCARIWAESLGSRAAREGACTRSGDGCGGGMGGRGGSGDGQSDAGAKGQLS